MILLFSNALFAQSNITWNMGMNLAASSFGNMHPRIVTNASGDPLVVWNHAMRVMFSKWNGTAFTMPVMLNPVSMSVAGASWMGPDIAAHGDTVYIVFKLVPEADTSSHIYIIRSFDGGISFSQPSQVDQIGDSISRFPTLTVDDNGNPIVAFMKFDASFMDSRWVVSRSNDFGNTFSTDTKASGWSGGVICDCCPGALASGGNNVLMVYRDNLNNLRDQWAGISTDNGNSFVAGMPVDQNNWNISSCPSSGPDAVIIGDNLHTVYMSSATGSSRVYYSVSSISAMTGSSGNEITGTFAGLSTQNYPRIATDGTAMGIAWKQNVNNIDQCVLLFTNDIATGFPSAYDTVDLDQAVNVDVAIANGNVFVVWEDDNAGTIKFRSGTFNSTTGLAEHHIENLISVYPNPSADFIKIRNLSQEKTTVEIYDLIGEEMVLLNLDDSGRNDVSISNWPDGIYFVSARSNAGSTTQKIIVRH